MQTRSVKIVDADFKTVAKDRHLLLVLAFTDTDEPATAQYMLRQSVHGPKVLGQLLKVVGIQGKTRLDKLFESMIGKQFRARIDKDGALCGGGHWLKNQFETWEDHPIKPVD